MCPSLFKYLVFSSLSLLFASLLTAEPACPACVARAQAQAAVDTAAVGYPLEGQIVTVLPTRGLIVFHHLAVDEVVPEMKIGVRVEPPEMLDSLHPGQFIRAHFVPCVTGHSIRGIVFLEKSPFPAKDMAARR